MKNNLINIENKDKITSLELVEQINLFREKERKRELRHDILLKIIRNEFEEEISLQKILESTYKNERGKEYPMFILTLSQAKQVLVRESKFVRRAIIKYIEELEEALKIPKKKDIEVEIPTLYDQLKSANKMINMLSLNIKQDIKEIENILARIDDYRVHIKIYSSVLNRI